MPPAAPIVHIGFPKTATTWFQKSFYPHVRNLAYVDRARVNAALLSGNAFSFDPAEARATLGIGDGEAVILCEEGLSGYLHNGGLAGYFSKEMAHRIKAALPAARIVIFLRSQPAMIAAAYQQYVRGGGTYSPARFLFPADHLVGANAEAYKQPRFDIDHFAYSPLIEHYEKLFGRENIHIFLFEQFRANRENFLKHFVERLDLDVALSNVPLRPRLQSYSLALTRLARFFNLFTARAVADKHHLLHVPGWFGLRRSLLEALNRSRLFGAAPSPEHLLGSATVAWLEARFSEDNRRLAERCGLPLAQNGYPLPGISNQPERPRPAAWRHWLAR